MSELLSTELDNRPADSRNKALDAIGQADDSMIQIHKEITKTIETFFSSTNLIRGAHQKSSFAYIAVKNEDKFILIQGFLHLTERSQFPFSHFTSENIRAGHYALSELNTTAQTFTETLLSGKIETPYGELCFPWQNPNGFAASCQPFHPVGLQTQNRLNVLRISGDQQFRYLNQPSLDWELKASPTPYENLQELMFEYGLGSLHNDAIAVDIIASHVAAVDLSSKIHGTKAGVSVVLLEGLDTQRFSLGYKVHNQGKVVARSLVEGKHFKWALEKGIQKGYFEIDVPEASVLYCVANYDGLTQHYGWISDPETLQNPRRAAYEVFDNKLEIIRETLSTDSFRGKNARDLESAAAWILWMLGFSVLHLNMDRTKEAVDLIATTPNGNMAVIEVTSGLLKTENKLALLHDRSQSVRRGLDSSGIRHVNVLTVMITSQPRSDIQADLESAEKLGILVIAREDLEQALTRTIFSQNPDQLYMEAEQSVKDALSKHQTPLPN